MVHEVTLLIPHGRVTSYGAIARYLGTPRSSRMVGWAMNSSFKSDHKIPAHRVVNAKGLLTGASQFPEPSMMKRLLEEEGVRVENNQVQSFLEVFWDPTLELAM